MREFDIFVPLHDNDGDPFDAELYQQLQDRLLGRFQGLTYFPQANQGIWQYGGVTYRDEIVVYRVIAAESSGLGDFFSELKVWMKKEFAQLEILIIERKIGLL